MDSECWLSSVYIWGSPCAVGLSPLPLCGPMSYLTAAQTLQHDDVPLIPQALAEIPQRQQRPKLEVGWPDTKQFMLCLLGSSGKISQQGRPAAPHSVLLGIYSSGRKDQQGIAQLHRIRCFLPVALPAAPATLLAAPLLLAPPPALLSAMRSRRLRGSWLLLGTLWLAKL